MSNMYAHTKKYLWCMLRFLFGPMKTYKYYIYAHTLTLATTGHIIKFCQDKILLCIDWTYFFVTA